MEKVVDAIHKNIPVQISSMHWKVGPLQGNGSDDSDDDILAQSNAKTFASRQTDYDLMTTDDQVAVATAAAAAAKAMELEHRRHRHYQQQGFFLSGIGIKRRQRDSNHHQLKPTQHQPPQVILQEVFQGIRERAERTPQYMQEIRERTPQYMQEIRERTPHYMQEIREKTPRYVRTAIQNVREQVWQADDHEGPQYDCDASGRSMQQVSGDSQYSDALNELEGAASLELRDQPPPHYNSNFIPSRYEQVWNQFCQNNPRLANTAAAAMNKVAPTAATTAAASSSSASEYYVNFSDGDAQKAISAATITKTKRGIGTATTHNTTTSTVSMSGYADMDDECIHSPPLQSRNMMDNSNANPAGTVFASQHQQQQQQDKDHQVVSSQDRTSHVQPPLHSTANYQWGAKKQTSGSDVLGLDRASTSVIATNHDAIQNADQGTDVDSSYDKQSDSQHQQEETLLVNVDVPEEQSDPESDNDNDEDVRKNETNHSEEQPPTDRDEDPSTSTSSDIAPSSYDSDTNETPSPCNTSMHSTAKVHWGAATCKKTAVDSQRAQ